MYFRGKKTKQKLKNKKTYLNQLVNALYKPFYNVQESLVLYIITTVLLSKLDKI